MTKRSKAAILEARRASKGDNSRHDPRHSDRPSHSSHPDSYNPVPHHSSPTPTFTPKTDKQRLLANSIQSQILTIATGPAGVGKTYVALSIASQMLLDRKIDRILVTRPLVAVEDESLGFLKGEFDEKCAPWAAPSLDILNKNLGISHVKNLQKNGRVEFAPLAYMRGSTFDHCFVLMTEAQNASVAQTKMLLTRVGYGSRVVLDGDLRQSDLGGGNGLVDACDRLVSIGRHVEFEVGDIVRSGFCRDVVRLYEG